jgi:hypothetical protein
VYTHLLTRPANAPEASATHCGVGEVACPNSAAEEISALKHRCAKTRCYNLSPCKACAAELGIHEFGSDGRGALEADAELAGLAAGCARTLRGLRRSIQTPAET